LAAAAFSFGMVGFALCAHAEGLVLPRLVGLAMAVIGLAWGIAVTERPLEMIGLAGFRGYRLVYVPLAIMLGIALAMYYRAEQQLYPLPGRLTWFCLVAIGIGVCEELGYRGFLQGCLRKHGLWLACLGGAIGHTMYKCALFALPDVPVRADFAVLAGVTLGFGVLFGLMREAFGSLAFPVAAHVAFDLVAYGDQAAAPWWV
jgi:membrane protease YdiL (CAAX protease family)